MYLQTGRRHVEFIWEEELLLPELLVFCPLVALGCRCARWPEASRLLSPGAAAPLLLRTADTEGGEDTRRDQTTEEMRFTNG